MTKNGHRVTSACHSRTLFRNSTHQQLWTILRFNAKGTLPWISSHSLERYGTSEEVKGVDYENVRLLLHSQGLFTQDCTDKDVENIRWLGKGDKQVE
jgi:hypothetical protein